jgi:hemerythrin
MTLLNWKDEYSVGIAAVDHEHKELIELINRLYDELNKPGAKSSASKFFGDLLRGISAHFALEERIMRDLGYERMTSHKHDHERLLEELRDMMDAYEQSDTVDVLELAPRLDQWFSRHFRTHDAEFHHALGEQAH